MYTDSYEPMSRKLGTWCHSGLGYMSIDGLTHCIRGRAGLNSGHLRPCRGHFTPTFNRAQWRPALCGPEVIGVSV